MNSINLPAPQLLPISQCVKSLEFDVITPWPQGLPAVAINHWIVAGFHQDLVFNHRIPLDQTEKIAELMRSLYFDLSFVELARLAEKVLALSGSAKDLSWFPLEMTINKFGYQANELFFKMAQVVLKTPIGFQNWCAEKKVGPQDLMPLAATEITRLNPIFRDILTLKVSKSVGMKILEWAVDLLLMGHPMENLEAGSRGGEEWAEALRLLRYPATAKLDEAAKTEMTNLPWPGQSQARWVRQGDKSGIELKLFVTQPSDLKKYLQSLSQVEDMMDSKLKH